jgi:beta-N-acetylhexosaminidase
MSDRRTRGSVRMKRAGAADRHRNQGEQERMYPSPKVFVAFPARPRRVLSLVLATLLAAPIGAAIPVARAVSPAPTSAALIGQKLMVAMSGTTPEAALLGRIGRGEVGGVILFGANITTAGALRALTAKLQAAAAGGGRPPLLIATDQEGGSVRRVPWAPPTLSPPQMGTLGSASTAGAQGTATGRVLRCVGINTDLAPIADRR